MAKKLININKIPKDKTTYTRPEGAGNFDNMDDMNIVNQVNTKTGTVDLAPTLDKHIVNKKYVDDSFPVTHASTTGQTTDDHHVAFVKGDADLLYGDIALEHASGSDDQVSSDFTHNDLGGIDAGDINHLTDVQVAALHAQSHTVASHSDTTATGTELNTLTDNSMADTLHRHSELSASDGTPNPAVSVDAAGNVGLQTPNPRGALEIRTDGAGTGAETDDQIMIMGGADGTNATQIKMGVNNAGDYSYIQSTVDGVAHADLSLNPLGGNVGIGNASPTAKAHVDQSSTTAAIPVLTLDQADISEEMIEFVTTIGTGNPIEAVAAKTLTTTHFIKVTLPGGLTRYIPAGTIA